MYQITFVNDFAVSLTLEVRSGSAADCNQNAQRCNQSLDAGATYTLNTTDNVVCYRRTADPDNPGGGLGGWNTFSPDDNNTPATINL